MGPPEPFKKKTGKLKKKKMAKNAPKKRKKKKIVSGPLGNVKTYLDTKFQQIWPSNEARASSDHFFGKKNHFFEKLSFFSKKSFFFIFLLCQPLGLWVPTRPPRRCGRVGTHHGGVRSDFRCLQSHLKKKNGKIQI